MMETVSIRHLRGGLLRDRARRGRPLAVTSHRVLIGIVIPVDAWVESFVDYNWSPVWQSITEGERAVTAGKPIAMLDDVINDVDAAVWQSDDVPDDESEGMAPPFLGTAAGAAMEEESESLNETLTFLSESIPTVSTVRTIDVWDLYYDLIDGRIGRRAVGTPAVAVTDEQEVVSVFVPMTQDLVEDILEKNMSRVLYDIALAEKQLDATEEMITLDEESSDDTATLDQEAAELTIDGCLQLVVCRTAHRYTGCQRPLFGNVGRLPRLWPRETLAGSGAGGHVGGQDVVRVAV